jgi:hypothetical protein
MGFRYGRSNSPVPPISARLPVDRAAHFAAIDGDNPAQSHNHGAAPMADTIADPSGGARIRSHRGRGSKLFRPPTVCHDIWILTGAWRTTAL